MNPVDLLLSQYTTQHASPFIRANHRFGREYGQGDLAKRSCIQLRFRPCSRRHTTSRNLSGTGSLIRSIEIMFANFCAGRIVTLGAT